jgi:WhiB family redox-sensing transcriptional regulator
MDWLAEAACRGADTNLFYPDTVGCKASEAAKDICQGCPVVTECLDWAMRNTEIGVWGNTTDKERVKLRRQAGIRPRRITYFVAGDRSRAS